MSKHTPGPWQLHGNVATAVVGASGFVVAACGGHSNTLRDSAELEAELEANARLVAAAPDLYEALLIVTELASQEWQEQDGSRKGATDNDGRRLWFISEAAMESARAALAKVSA